MTDQTPAEDSAGNAGAGPHARGIDAPAPATLLAKLNADASARDIFICILVALAETMLLLVAMLGGISLPAMLLVHCAIMLLVTLLLDQRERQRLDSRILAVAVVTTAVSGPIGATLSALLGIYLRYRKLESELLEKWYDRISGHAETDAASELHERIQAGRTLNPHVDSRARFAAILRSGPMDEKQRVLSIITQKYHPSFAGLLQLALRNQDPPIRVQAAAVAARLKEHERLKIRRLIADAAEAATMDVRHLLDVAGKLAVSLDSGLLDEQDASACRSLAKSLCRQAADRAPDDVDAPIRLASLLAAEHNDRDAAVLLEPLAQRGVQAAVPPLHACLIRQRRFAQAAVLMEQAQRDAPPVSTPISTPSAPSRALAGEVT